MAVTKMTKTKQKRISRAMEPEVKAVEPEEVKAPGVLEVLAMRNQPKTTEVDLGDGVTVNVVSKIGFADMNMLIQTVVDACVDEERGEVRWGMFEYAMGMAVCAAYCGIAAPDDYEVGYAAVCGRDGLYNKIAGHIDIYQRDQIWESARGMLEAKEQMFSGAAAKLVLDIIAQMNGLMEALGSAVEGIDNESVEEALQKLMPLAKGALQ